MIFYYVLPSICGNLVSILFLTLGSLFLYFFSHSFFFSSSSIFLLWMSSAFLIFLFTFSIISLNFFKFAPISDNIDEKSWSKLDILLINSSCFAFCVCTVLNISFIFSQLSLKYPKLV